MLKNSKGVQPSEPAPESAIDWNLSWLNSSPPATISSVRPSKLHPMEPSPQRLYVGIECGLLFDGLGSVQKTCRILIKGNIIVKVGKKADVIFPAAPLCQVIDLSDAFVCPGFIDCHVHPFIHSSDYQVDCLRTSTASKALKGLKILQRMLFAGWTSVRVAGDADLGFGMSALKQSIERREHIGPRLCGANHFISITGGGGDINQLQAYSDQGAGSNLGSCLCHRGPADGVIVDSSDEMRRAVRKERKHGSDWIKLLVTGAFMSSDDIESPKYSHFSSAEVETAVAEAKRLGMSGVMCHAHGSEGIITAIIAGARSIEHGSFINQQGIDLMLRHQCWLVPTLTVHEFSSAAFCPEGAQAKMLALQEATAEESFKCLRNAAQAGVKIALGSDYIGWDPIFTVREFELMVKTLDISPLEALKAGTSNAAQLLTPLPHGITTEGKGHIERVKVGVLREGCLADVVALEGNPSETISDVRRLFFVMKDGNIVRHDDRPSRVTSQARL